MSSTRFGLSAEVIAKIGHVFAANSRVEKAVLYGSRAKGNYKNGSDIDLTLHGENLAFHDLLALMGKLDDLLLPYTIDLSIFAMLQNAPLREHISRVGQEFYAREVPLARLTTSHG